MDKQEYIKNIEKKCNTKRIKEIIAKFKGIKTLVIGDAIIDEYHFTIPKGRATKDPILSVDYVNHEVYAGGALVIANNVSNFVDEVTLLTMLGDKENRKEFITSSLNKNITTKFFVKKNSPTTTKKRYLNSLRNEKLFKVEHINDTPLVEELENEILDFLERKLPEFDLVLIGDFGHSLITKKIIRLLEAKSNYITINVQSNSANLGFNFVTKYKSPNFVTLDEPELQYAVSDRFSETPILMKKLYANTQFNKFLVTMGKGGVTYSNKNQQTFFPAFITRPQDTIGAGDAVFSITSLFSYCNYDELIPFIANCVGGIAVSYLGNRENITKEKLLKFIEEVYNGGKRIY